MKNPTAILRFFSTRNQCIFFIFYRTIIFVLSFNLKTDKIKYSRGDLCKRGFSFSLTLLLRALKCTFFWFGVRTEKKVKSESLLINFGPLTHRWKISGWVSEKWLSYWN